MPNPARRIGAALSTLPLLAIGLTVMGAGVVVGPISPASADVGCTSSGTTTITVNCPVGLADTWTVPTGVVAATFNVDGAQGGSSFNGDSGGSPGEGGELTATMLVTAGQTYDIEVGAVGGDAGGTSSGEFASFAGAGGAPGGATGGLSANTAGGGGGGASIVALADNPSNYLLIAGGGGGEGSSIQAAEQGGFGGGTEGGDGGSGAPGGTQAAGSGSGTQINGSTPDGPGGGGGGGYWGGAGAVENDPDAQSAADGAGGGSGFAPSASDFLTTTKSGNGSVTITYNVSTTCSDPTGTSPGPFTVTCPVGIADDWTVPAGVTSAMFTVDGAEGGTAVLQGDPGGAPGEGGELVATLPVSAGQIYSVAVGASGGDATGAEGSAVAGVGGAPGGAAGGNDPNGFASGGGGGASLVSLAVDPSNYLLIAGGGGGEGAANPPVSLEIGGNGGGAVGGSGSNGAAAGGTQAAGSGSGMQINGSSASADFGAGGGGGYWGGAGAPKGGGGGGGSGFAPSVSDFLSATNSGDGSVTIVYSLQVAPSFTSAADTSFSEDTASTFSVTTSGAPTVNSIVSDAAVAGCTPTSPLPTGLTFSDNGDGTGVIASMAATPAGTYTLCLTASNGVSPDALQTFTLTIDRAPTITSASSATFTTGTAGSFSVTTAGLPLPALTNASFAGCTPPVPPTGLTFNDNGDGTGTIATTAATPSGIYTLCLNATNGNSPDATQTFTLTIDGPPSFTSPNSATFLSGKAGTFTVTTTGLPTVNSITGADDFNGCTPSAAPHDVTFTDNGNGTATLTSTTATPPGSYRFCFTASNGISPDATQIFTLTVGTTASGTSGSGSAGGTGSGTGTGAGTGGTGTGGTGTISTPPPSSTPGGYDLVGSDGGVFVFPEDGPGFFGSLPGQGVHTNDIVGMVPTADDGGYWLIGRDGGVFAFGDAPYLGSVPSRGYHVDNIVGLVADPATGGYWVIGADGSIYDFNAAQVGGLPLLGTHVSNIVGGASTPDGGDLYLVSSTGKVYVLLGDGHFQGDVSTLQLNAPIVSITVDPSTGGYWLLGKDGGVFTFNAPFFGSTGGMKLDQPVVGLVPSANGLGYLLFAADGGIFNFGNSVYKGSLPGIDVKVDDIVGAVATS